MIAFQQQNPSFSFVHSQFQHYYNTVDLPLPDRFSRREFAFVVFNGKGMHRHLGFTKKDDVIQYIQEKTPVHAYYSSAYYQYPSASTMKEKEWMGAELIFDLDSDHLPNADQLSYEQSLDLVKQEFIKLVHEFLLDDFGFKKKDLELYFSGGRGYHCHVKDPVVMDLDSDERREIVDYIIARDLQDSIIFREHATGKKEYHGRVFASGKRLEMPQPSEPGWNGRISREIINIVDTIRQSNDPKEKLKEYGVSSKDAEKLVEELSDSRVQRIKDGYLDQSKTLRRFFLNNALRKTAVALSAGETDEPVTCDVKRLIRLPLSHGKTGFQVKAIHVDNLEDFEPLTEAVVLSDELVNVEMNTTYSITLKDTDFSLEKGRCTVPIYLAVFLIGRKLATIPDV